MPKANTTLLAEFDRLVAEYQKRPQQTHPDSAASDPRLLRATRFGEALEEVEEGPPDPRERAIADLWHLGQISFAESESLAKLLDAAFGRVTPPKQ